MLSKFISIIGIMIFFTGCFEDEKIVEKEKIKVVKILDLGTAKNFTYGFKHPAVINSLQDTKMAFEVSGKITKFFFKEGDFVKKGSSIAKLDETVYKADYNSALSNLKQAKLDYKRYKKLYDVRAVAKRALEEKKQILDQNSASHVIALKRLNDTKLVAEFDGIMAKKYVKDFARITAKQEIIRFQDNSSYKVKFYVSESDVLKQKNKLTEKYINENIEFFVYLGNNKDKIPAKFHDITTTAEEVTRTFEVTLTIPNIKDRNILPGMTANVEIIKKNQEIKVLYIPLKAVFTDSSKKSFVWIKDKKNRVHKVEVTIGKLKKDSVEIINGLNSTSIIITSGVRFLNENDQVKEYEKIGN